MEKIRSIMGKINNIGLKSRIKHVKTDGLVEVEYYVGWGGEYELFEDFLQLINTEKIAPQLRALTITGSDEGANGTRNWELGPLDEGEAIFSNLEILEVEGTLPGHHNRTIVTGNNAYDENGILGQLLDRMPELRILSVPSAPSENFFQRDTHPLEELIVQTGYDHQNFIQNLVQSSCFPNLRKLEFTDYSESYMTDYQEQKTPEVLFIFLLESLAVPSLEELMLYNTRMDRSNISKLRETTLGRKLKTLLIEEKEDVL